MNSDGLTTLIWRLIALAVVGFILSMIVLSLLRAPAAVGTHVPELERANAGEASLPAVPLPVLVTPAARQ